MPARYAVYYAPSAGDALHQAVTPLLGRDALGGLNVPQATPPGVDPVFWKAVTRVPAHYGLHATLKAPFELRHSGMDSQLLRSTGEVASRFLPFVIPSLSLAYLGKEEKGFYALVPSTKCSLLSFLERACVMDLDAFRAPLKTEDVARRGHLSLEERSNLYMWGYHRVLDSFQFHITLTDGIADAGLRALVGAGLRKALEGVLDAPLRIDALTLFKQENRNRPFSAVARLPFANVQTAQETAGCLSPFDKKGCGCWPSHPWSVSKRGSPPLRRRITR